MANDDRDLLEVLKFELEFLEKGGYGRSPRTAWRPQFIFEDSPTCLNFGDPHGSRPCDECVLMQLVPAERRSERVPCRHIPLNAAGETVDSYYRTGTQWELEKALADWLRATIRRLEEKGPREASPNPDSDGLPLRP